MWALTHSANGLLLAYALVLVPMYVALIRGRAPMSRYFQALRMALVITIPAGIFFFLASQFLQMMHQKLGVPQFLFAAKGQNIPTVLVGHVTKDGNLAGPKALEHVVDTVLYFEGESGQSYRLLRAVKNRFGRSQELGVFEMGPEGLVEVKNPSALFLSERKEPVSGVAVTMPLKQQILRDVGRAQTFFRRLGLH